MMPNQTPVADEILASRDDLLAFIRSRGVSPEEAEDVLHDSLLRALGAQEALRNRARLVPWLYQIVRNALADHYRDTARRTSDQDAGDLAPDDDEHRMLCRCVEALIPLLPDAQAQLIVAVDLEGESSTSAAARLGITRNALKVRLHRARTALRERLTETCRACAEHGCLDCACRTPG